MSKLEKTIVKIVEIEARWWPPPRRRIADVLREHFGITIAVAKLSTILRRLRRDGDLVCCGTVYLPRSKP